MSDKNDKRALHWICRDGHSVRLGDWYLAQRETAIMRGELFMCFGELIVPSGATKICQLKTGDVDTFAYGLRLESNVENLVYSMHEAPTITDGTTTIPAVNYDRTSTNLPLYRIYTDPTNVSGGTLIAQYRHYSLPSAPALSDANETGFMFLKRNTNYSLSFTNNDNNERNIFVRFVIQENKYL